MKEVIVIVLMAITLTVITIILFYFNFRFISGLICFLAVLSHFALCGMISDLYQEYKYKKEQTRRDRERLIEDIMES